MTRENIIKEIKNMFAGKYTQVVWGKSLANILNCFMGYIDSTSPTQGNPYKDITRLGDYLYLLDYNNIDYDYAIEYFKDHQYPVIPTGCSSIKSGSFLGRNLDWEYNNMGTCVIRTPAKKGINWVLGVAGINRNLTEEVLNKGKYNEAYKIVPFQLLDGINEAGLVVTTNVVPKDKGDNTIVKPTSVTGKPTLCTTMLPRYILDHFSTLDDAIEFIQKGAIWYNPKGLSDMGYEAHWFISNKTKAYAVEFINGEVVVTETDVMTNFHIDDVIFNEDGSVYTNASVPTHAPTVDNRIEEHGQGLERFNILVAGKATANTQEGMRTLLNSIRYTNTYKTDTNPLWYSEFTSKKSGITVDTPTDDAKFTAVIAAAREAYTNRDRNNPKTWQTVHSSIYNFDNKVLYLCVQEKDTEYVIAFDQNSYDIDSRIGNLASLETDHKSNLVEAINEIYDIIETDEMVISMAQSNAERKVIYDACIAHPQLSKNIVFLNANDNLYYRVNGYKIDSSILYLNTIMVDTDTIRSVTVQISSTGSIAV